MRRWLYGLTGAGALLGAAAAAAPARPPEELRRGAYLVRFGGCNDCHTPMAMSPQLGVPAPDMARMLSGHPEGAPDPGGTLGESDMALIGPTFTSFKLPMGTVYTPNLTPDPDTGIGRWTAEQFIQAMRTGKHLGSGRAILPPMPWSDLAGMTDADLRAIFAYLKSIKPIHNAVPAPKVAPEALDKQAKVNAQIAAMARQAPK